MEYIFHEKQEGSLCAQHCLNALLQGQYFSAVDLADIARQLDESERQHMAEAGVHSDEYQRFMQQASSNYDDSGFFSIQVIQSAMRVWNLDLIPYKSQNQVAVQARADPTTQQAYICNFKEHWFSVRKLGHQWFNLNSLLSGPELISDTYLSMFLTQLQTEGYAIFVVVGIFPDCEADSILKILPAVQPIKPHLLTNPQRGSAAAGAGAQSVGDDPQDAELQRALEESRRLVDDDDQALSRVLQLSMADADLSKCTNVNPQPSTAASHKDASQSPGASSPPSAEELRLKRLAYLDKNSPASTSRDSGSSPNQNRSQKDPSESESRRETDEMTEEEMLQEAIKLSLQPS